MISSSSKKGLLPAGLSDILYPDARIQAKTTRKSVRCVLKLWIYESKASTS